MPDLLSPDAGSKDSFPVGGKEAMGEHEMDLYAVIDHVQTLLHGAVSPEILARLKTFAPALQIIKSLIVHESNLADLTAVVEDLAPYVNAFITDTFDPATGASGATGKTHDWTVSRKLVELSPKPVILAGGLNPSNVYERFG